MSVEYTDGRQFAGELWMPGDPGYMESCFHRVYHSRLPARLPAAVLRAANTDDVVAGVHLARERGWIVGLRSGGHSFPVWGVREGGLLIDLANLNDMSFDRETGIVRVGPAIAGGRELNPYLEQFGMFFPGGGCSDVGLGGFLLQGGIGWNFRGWGFSAEQIVAIDVVTADGELVHADEKENSDLFWAARGAGPGYCGVITNFYLRTRPLPQGLSSTLQIFSADDYADVLDWLCAEQVNFDPLVHLVAISLVPQFPIPGHRDGELGFAIWAVAFCDSMEEADAALRPIIGGPFAEKAEHTVPPHPTTLEAEYAFVDSSHPPNRRYRVDSAWVEGSPKAITSASTRLVLERPRNEPGHTFFQFALPRQGPDMAMSLRTNVMVGAYIIYQDAADDDRYQDWLLSAMGELEPLTIGQYWGDSDQQVRRVKCLTDDAWKRLRRIRAERDPDGVFADYLAGSVPFDNTNEWQTEGSS
ncbi:FAD-binding oxidoreductase [Nocardia aurea]|uniref:FAD-binding oxidoreductase n=1 Tax=Nocardia aurea TaxID=2144174 RepID=UPI000D69CC85|nr:FAD-binding oxidoreductase [Nocardia aurea]